MCADGTSTDKEDSKTVAELGAVAMCLERQQLPTTVTGSQGPSPVIHARQKPVASALAVTRHR